MTGVVERPPHGTTEYARFNLEWASPGGWWRRDLMLKVLAAIYPRWMPAGAFPPIIARLRNDPREASCPIRRRTTMRTLSRLHGLRLVDRYGEPGGLRGRTKGNDWSRGWRMHNGHRYRLRRTGDDLL